VIKDTGVVGAARRGNRDEAGGRRACLMVRAVAAAKAGDCDKAFKLTLICQCHDGTAQEHLKAAGPRAVCGYLMAK
jgi:hypothetical protein